MGNEEVNGMAPLPPATPEEYEAWRRQQEEYWASVPKQLSEAEAEIGRDLDWALYDPEVQRLYPDMVVAVHKRKVVAAGEDMIAVMEEAERITGLPRNQIAITTVFGPKLMLGSD